MPRTLFLPLLLLLATSCLANPLKGPEVEIAKRLDDGVGPACLAVGWVGAVGETSVSEAAFFCHPEAKPGSQFVIQSMFEIGSVSKGLTGLLLADMVVRGEVRLDDPASKYSRPGAKLPTRKGREITLRDVVTHTAGLPKNPPTLKIVDRRDTYANFDVDDLYASLAVTQLASDIGTTHSYSNFGFMWLSEMLTRAGGRTLAELLQDRVLGPLGMGLATLDQGIELHAVVGHSPRYVETPAWHFKPALAGMGGVRATIEDMERLAEALSGRRKTPLDEAIKLAVTPLFRINDVDSIGYAWMTRRVGGSTLLWHNGQTGGFSSMVVVDRDKRSGTVVLADTAALFQDLAFHLLDPQIPLLPAPIRLPVDAATRQAFVGSYQVPNDVTLDVSQDGETLLICCTDLQPWPVELARQDATWFALLGFPIKLALKRNPDGSVEGLDIDAGGQKIFAKRL